MKRSDIRCVLLLGLALIFSCNALFSAQTSDEVEIRGKELGKGNPLKGTIKSDSYTGVKIIQQGNVERNISRSKVRLARYHEVRSIKMDDAIEAYKGGNYGLALRLFSGIEDYRAVSSAPVDRKKLILQHTKYYKAMCIMRLSGPKRYKQGAAAFSDLFAFNKKTFWYFEARLAQAECIANLNAGKGLSRYETIIKRDFPSKRDANPAKPLKWVDRYILRAQIGHLRLALKHAIKRGRDPSDIGKLKNVVSALESGHLFKKWASETDRAELVRQKATIYKLLGKHKELVGILDLALRKTVSKADQRVLGGMYLDRGDAYYTLAETAPATEKAALQKRALLDYLHASIGPYKLDADRVSEVHFRIAGIFRAFKGPEWKRRSLWHLGRIKEGKYLDRAKDMKKEIRGGNKAKGA